MSLDSENKEGRPPPLIVLDGVSYTYPGAEGPALDGVTLTIERGAFVGVMGPTGAGKSTLCQALNGIVPQFFGGRFFGHASVAGRDTIDTPTSDLAAGVGMVFEDPETQITATTVESEVAFALENLCVPTPEIARRVADALGAAGLAGLESKHPANLSGGQKQRLAIAAAIALAPELIVLDEPTSQLDPVGTRDVFALLKRLNHEQGITIVLASHASEELAEVAGRIVLLVAGRVVDDGPPERVLGAVPFLTQHHIRPPDIAQAFQAVSERLHPEEVGVAPVTVAAATTAFEPYRIRIAPAAAAFVPSRLAAAGPVALATEGLSHIYPDGTRALSGIELSIKRGSFTAIAGRNGSGKSTLVRHFLNLLEPSAGRVLVDGRDVSGLKISELARRIGYVAQNAHQQLFCDSVAEEVGFALAMERRPKSEIDTAVASGLAAMQLESLADRHPQSLSRGDRLRVAIAAVLALEPEILIFDEPTTGQDWRGALAVLDISRDLNRRGKTVVIVTHHLYLLPGYADRLVALDSGRIVLDGSLRDVFYATEALERAALAAPQTVRFAAAMPELAAARPLSPADLAACVVACPEKAA